MMGIVRQGTIAVAFLAGASLIPFEAQADEVQYAWTGVYVGAGGGYGGVNHTVGAEAWDYAQGGLFAFGFPGTYPNGVDVFSIEGVLDYGGLGAFGTFEAGFDVQIGHRLVVGVVGGVDLSHINTNVSVFGEVCYEDAIEADDCDEDPVVVSDYFEGNLDFTLGRIWTIGGRVGILTSPSTLIYGLAAYSHVGLSVTPSYETGDTGPQSLEPEEIVYGAFTFGFGIETLLAPHVSAKLEYRGTTWSFDEVIYGDSDAGARLFADGYMQTIRATLAFRLGSHDAPAGFEESFGDDDVNWTGFHVDFGGGFGISNYRAGLEGYLYEPGGIFQLGDFPSEYPNGVDVFSIGTAADWGGRGPLGGAGAGLDVQFGDRVVMGAFGDYYYANIMTTFALSGEVCYEDDGGPDDCDEPYAISDEPSVSVNLVAGNMWTLGGRIGFLPSPRTLVYGLAGFTHVDFTAYATLESGTVEYVSDPYTFGRNTFTVGAGIETLLAENVSAKLEYRASYFTQEGLIGTPTVGIGAFNTTVIQTIRGGLSLRFGTGN